MTSSHSSSARVPTKNPTKARVKPGTRPADKGAGRTVETPVRTYPAKNRPAGPGTPGVWPRVQRWASERGTRRPELLLLTLFALITRMVNVTSPNAVVFDEVYFKTAAGGYRTHQYFFDPHPPLGKLLLSLWSWFSGQNPNTVASDKVADTVVRYLPAFAGAMLVPIVWTILRQLKGSRRVATLGALAVLLDNALIVESRFVLVDSMLLCFGMAAISLFLASRTRTGWRFWAFLVGSAFMGGATFSTKWTGLTALALIGLIWFYDVVTARRALFLFGNWKKPLAVAVIFVVLPPLIYVIVFWIHFSLLTHTGSGDAYMSARFQRTLIGSKTYDPNFHMSFWDKFWDTYKATNTYEKDVKGIGHPYGSRWNQWPLENRSIYYWAGASAKDGSQGNIYLLGNPAVWWGTVVGLIVVLSNLLFQVKRFKGYVFALCALGAGYLMNWLPFEKITRVMFLYHYLFALIFAIAIGALGLGVLMGWNSEPDDRFWDQWNWRRDVLYVVIVAVMLIGFVFISPLTYGFSISPSSLQNLMLLSKWR